MKAAIYLRQSSDPHNDQLGVSRQRQDCVKLCESKGWGWAEYTDNDVSATKRKPRPAYREMLADIRNGSIQAVVVWDLDRLHRQPRELEEFIDLADAKGLALATVTGDTDLSTDNGRLYARIKGAVAKAESERKVARMKRRYRQDAEAGRPNGVTSAFGYTPDHHLDPRESAAVAKAYDDVLSGRSLYSIAQEWNSHGFTSARGKAWTQTGVRAVLLNWRNAGISSRWGEMVTDPETGEPVKAVWPPVVSLDTFEAVRSKLTDPDRRRGATRGRRYLMSGLAVCGKCGKTVGSAMPSKRGQQARYHCKHCHGVARKIESVDDYVLDVVAERLSRKDAAEIFYKKDRTEVPKLRKKADALRQKQIQYVRDELDGKITRAQMVEATKVIEARLAEIDAKVKDAAKVRVLDGLIEPGQPQAVRQRLDALDLDRRRAVIDVLLTLTILPGQARGDLRLDLLPITWR